MCISISNWWRKRSIKKRFPKKEIDSPGAEDYRAVAINSGLEGCCAAAKQLAGKRFLMNEAPALPLPECDMQQCECRYKKFEDRRDGPRRGSEYGISNNFVIDNERRGEKRGRRKTDFE